MKVLELDRVSSKEQEETGYSLPAQAKLLEDYRKNKGLDLARKPFSITESAGGQKQRKTFDEMLAYSIKHDIKIIICEKVDRLTRNLRDAVAINEWLNTDPERQVHFVKENVVLSSTSKSNEKFIWNIKVSVAQYYIDNLSEEVKKGQKEKIAQGWLPTKPPLGYKTVGEKGHKIHVIDEEKAPLVKKMFELYATGEHSILSLTDWVYKEGLRTDYGNKITKSRIHQYLRDPFYIGVNRWNEVEYPGNQEPLIEKPLFKAVQAMLTGKTTLKLTKHNFLFKGLIYCYECGGLITWETAKGHVYGHCNHYRNCSQSVWAKEPQVEEQLAKFFQSLEVKSQRLSEWIKKALKESHKDEIAYHSTSVGEISKQHDTIKARIDKLYDEKLDGKITEAFYQQKFKQYSEELTAVDKSINKHTNASLKYLELGINLYELSQNAVGIYNKALLDQKRLLMRLVFERLILNEGVLEVKYTKAFQILHDAVLATNSSKLEKVELKTDKILEPLKKPVAKAQSGDFSGGQPVWLRGLDSNQEPFA